MGKVSLFFSHDKNASQDPKILQMCSVYKAEGYGWFWMLIEKMSEQENYKLPIKGKYAIDAYAMRMYCDGNALKKFIEDCVKEFLLFQTDGEFLWSESLNRRMEYWEIKSKIGKKAADARWHKDALAMQPQCVGNTNKQNKTKQNKLNNSLMGIYKIYEDEIGLQITPMVASELVDIEKEYGLDIFRAACKKAVSNGVRNLNYLRPILEQYKLSGIPSGDGKNSPEQTKPISKFNDGWNTGL